MHLRFVAAQTTLLVSEAAVGEKAKGAGIMRIRKERLCIMYVTRGQGVEHS